MSTENKQTWSDSIMSKMSKKADAHQYILDLPQFTEHRELYQQAHARSFFSNSFKDVLLESNKFCADISNLKMNNKVS